MNQVRSIEKSLKMNGVSRDGGTKKYTNKSNIKMYFYFHNMKTVRIYLVAISVSNIAPVCVHFFYTIIATYLLHFMIIFKFVAVTFS